MRQLPAQPESANVRALAQWYRERFTGLTGTAITLAQTPVRTSDDVGLELVVKNGAILDPSGGASGYSITGPSITLGAAAIAGDVFLILYPYR